mmetsp:Transcript_55086/g.147024  ORF Transcript_55086/g.147024 Transcript_55086/m.147024 type:complete len:211 (-) Transcript_55086:796-1428(-)
MSFTHAALGHSWGPTCCALSSRTPLRRAEAIGTGGGPSNTCTLANGSRSALAESLRVARRSARRQLALTWWGSAGPWRWLAFSPSTWRPPFTSRRPWSATLTAILRCTSRPVVSGRVVLLLVGASALATRRSPSVRGRTTGRPTRRSTCSTLTAGTADLRCGSVGPRFRTVKRPSAATPLRFAGPTPFCVTAGNVPLPLRRVSRCGSSAL